MNVHDRGIRDLLPILPEAPASGAQVIDWSPGPAAQAITALPQPLLVPHTPTGDGPLARLGDPMGGTQLPRASEPEGGSPSAPPTFLDEADDAVVRGPAADESFAVPKAAAVKIDKGAGGGLSRETAGSAERDGEETEGPRRGGSQGDDPDGTGEDAEADTDGPDPAGAETAPEDLPDVLIDQEVGFDQKVALALGIGGGDTGVAIVQDADVDQDAHIALSLDKEAILASAHIAVDGDQGFSIRQDASVDVTGWEGKVVTRIILDQNLALDQDFEVTVFVDEDGEYDVRVDQDLLVDQDISLAIALDEEDGTLYVDMTVVDRTRIEQDTSVLVGDDGDGESEAAVVQDVEVAQDLFVSLDVEDSLDDRYDVSLSLQMRQAVDVDQDAEIGLEAKDDGVEIEVEADQVAGLDQEIAVRLDFAVV